MTSRTIKNTIDQAGADQTDNVEVGIGDGLRKLLNDKGARYCLGILGASLDSGHLSVDRAQIALNYIAPGNNINDIAIKYSPLFFQRPGWKGILTRFANATFDDLSKLRLHDRIIQKIYSHLAIRAPIYLWATVAIIAFSRYFILTINVSDSLPGKVFLVQKGSKPQRGELAAFRYGGGGPYEQGVLFLKRALGTQGSEVVARDSGDGYRDYFVDGQPVGRAKPLSKAGMPLQAGPTGTIPAGHFYMMAPNPDSLDSRYALVGWVSESQLVGRAIAIF